MRIQSLLKYVLLICCWCDSCVAFGVSPRSVIKQYYAALQGGDYDHAVSYYAPYYVELNSGQLSRYLSQLYLGRSTFDNMDIALLAVDDDKGIVRYAVNVEWVNPERFVEEASYDLAPCINGRWKIVNATVSNDMLQRVNNRERYLDLDKYQMYRKICETWIMLDYIAESIVAHQKRENELPASVVDIIDNMGEREPLVNPFSEDGTFSYMVIGEQWVIWSEGPNLRHDELNYVYDISNGIESGGNIVLSSDMSRYAYMPGINRHPRWLEIVGSAEEEGLD